MCYIRAMHVQDLVLLHRLLFRETWAVPRLVPVSFKESEPLSCKKEACKREGERELPVWLKHRLITGICVLRACPPPTCAASHGPFFPPDGTPHGAGVLEQK